jgi:hypothetical protein
MTGRSVELSREDQEVIQHLGDAQALYERYLRVSDVGLVSATQDEVVVLAPPPTDVPLTLQVHIF